MGYAWSRAFGEELTVELIERIEGWVFERGVEARRRGLTFELWQATAIVSEYGRGKAVGSSPTRVQLPTLPQESEALRIEAALGGAVTRKLEDTAGRLVADLEDVLDEGLMGFVHAVEVNTFRRRTDAQRREYESRQRKRRAKEQARGKRRNK